MSMSYETFREGSETNGGASIAGGTTLQLTDKKLWVVLTATGGAGDVVLKLPFAKGLQLGATLFRFVFLSGSDQNTVIRNFTTGTDLTIFDANGDPRTSIDFTAKWGTFAGVEAILTANTTGDGGWLLYSS